MKLLTYSTPGTDPRPGVVVDGNVHDLRQAFEGTLKKQGVADPTRARLMREMTADLAAIIDLGPWGTDVIARAMEADADEGPTVEQVQLHAPLKPRRLRDCSVFEEHAKVARAKRGQEVPQVWYQMPVYYKGNPETILGPDDVVTWPSYSTYMDYELEIGIVIGRAGRDLDQAEALEHVLGLTVLNDFSARDIQQREMLGGLGPAKGKDFATSLGPWIVTLDEFPALDALTMTAAVDGEEWSRGSTADMHFGFAEIVAHASAGEWLLPGDVIGTGTCNGGSAFELDRRLPDGAVVELAVDGIGRLTNTVALSPDAR